MNLEIMHLARRIAEKHGVPPWTLLTLCRGRAIAKARRDLWGELHRLGCRQSHIAQAWGCAAKTVSEALDRPAPRKAVRATTDHATEERTGT